MSFLHPNHTNSLTHLPDLIVPNASKLGLQQQNKAAMSIKSLTKIPIDTPMTNNISKKSQQQFPKVQGQQQKLNQLRGFSTPKVALGFNSQQDKQFLVSNSNANLKFKRSLQKQATLNFEIAEPLKSKIFCNFSDLCENQDINCRTPTEDAQSQYTSDTTCSDKSPSQQSENLNVKQISAARFKSFKDINDAHNRHIEQKELIIANYKNQTLNLEAELQKKNQTIASQSNLIQNLQNNIQKLNEQLEEAEETVTQTEQKNTIIRSELNEQRREAPEFQTLLDENMFLKQEHNKMQRSKKDLEDAFNNFKSLLSNINNWPAVQAIQNPTSEQLNEFILSKVSDYNQRREEQNQMSEEQQSLYQKINILKEDYQRLEQEKRILKATIEMQECRIQALREDDGYSKVFNKITGISMRSIEDELFNIQKLHQKRQLLGEQDESESKNLQSLKSMTEEMKGNQSNVEKQLKQIENKLKTQYNSVQKYKFMEELDQLEHKADELLKCEKCDSTLYNCITHVPCGHSYCMDCHEDRKQKIELNDSIPAHEKQNKICSCFKCGSDKKGNWIFKNQQMDQITSLYKNLIKQKNMLKLLLSNF